MGAEDSAAYPALGGTAGLEPCLLGGSDHAAVVDLVALQAVRRGVPACKHLLRREDDVGVQQP